LLHVRAQGNCANFYYATELQYYKCVYDGATGTCKSKGDPTIWKDVCGAPLMAHQVAGGRRKLYEDVPPPAAASTFDIALSLTASGAMFAVGVMVSRWLR